MKLIPFFHFILKNFQEHKNLDSEDGGFHSTPTEGVFHQGFDREEFAAKLKRSGFADIEYVTAHIAVRANGSYPIFLALATKQ